MARLNPTATLERSRTHGGGITAAHVSAVENLRRAVATALLWEPAYYEAGDTAAARIRSLVAEVPDTEVAQIAVEARTRLKLRSVPLWLAACLAHKHKDGRATAGLVAATVASVIRRPDELAELLAMYWHLNEHTQTTNGRGTPHKRLSHQLKVGLARAFRQFDEYQLAKWNRGKRITLRDVLFLCHAKPQDAEQAALWKRLVEGKLETPDTWEVALSSGTDKRATWERLLAEQRLGSIALLANLRNMLEAGVTVETLGKAVLEAAPKSKALPFRYVSAARAAPKLETELEAAMLLTLGEMPKLLGRTLLVVDVSGSMRGALSARSKLDRVDAAGALTILVRETCEHATVYATAGDDCRQVHATAEIPARRGMALLGAVRDALARLGGGGIFLVQCMDFIKTREREPFDRVLVFTDEQDCDRKANPATAQQLASHNYIVNVASYEHGIASDGGWHRINGFSERVLDWVAENEFGQQTDN